MPSRAHRPATLAALAACLAACSSSSPAPPPASPPARTAPAVVSAAGRMSGGTLTLDVQLGRPFAQDPAAGGTVALGPASLPPVTR